VGSVSVSTACLLSFAPLETYIDHFVRRGTSLLVFYWTFYSQVFASSGLSHEGDLNNIFATYTRLAATLIISNGKAAFIASLGSILLTLSESVQEVSTRLVSRCYRLGINVVETLLVTLAFTSFATLAINSENTRHISPSTSIILKKLPAMDVDSDANVFGLAFDIICLIFSLALFGGSCLVSEWVQDAASGDETLGTTVRRTFLNSIF